MKPNGLLLRAVTQILLVCSGCSGDGGAKQSDGGTRQSDAGTKPSDGGTKQSNDAATPHVAVREFRVDACKYGPSGATLLTGRESADYAGLECLAWDAREPSSIKFDLINFDEGCGFGNGASDPTLWRGRASVNETGRLGLTMEWDADSPSACGACLHDFSFALEGLAIDDTLPLSLSTRSCTGPCDLQTEELSLPLGESPKGIQCRYVDWRGVSYDEGSLHAPPENGSCDEPLVPIAVGDVDLCASPCSDSTDCSPPDLLTCQNGTCQLEDVW